MIVRSIFIDTADNNYLIARWCFHNGLLNDFYWNALHALEKYLKSILLLNGKSAKANKNHNISDLLNKTYKITGNLIPVSGTLFVSNESNPLMRNKETLKEFIKRLDEFGNADNRYNLFGIEQMPTDLFKLDTCAFYLRRLVFSLDKLPLYATPENKDKSFKQILEEDQNLIIDWDKSALAKRLKNSESLSDVFYQSNVAFSHYAPDNFEHKPYPIKFSWTAPALFDLGCHDLSMEKTANIETKRELCHWVKANIQLSKSVEKEIEAQIESYTKHLEGISPL